jgi:hypothetical protein
VTATPSHQTIRISRGKHHDPSQGACVMELASMLAGEPFTDRPACACPVAGAFLRTYNDALDDRRRQDLRRFAALVVGTRGSAAVTRRRAELCIEWAQERVAGERRSAWRMRRLNAKLKLPSRPSAEDCGSMAARVASALLRRGDDGAHAAALAFVERLLTVGDPGARRSRALSGADHEWLALGIPEAV